MVQNFMTTGVFYVSASNLHDLSFPIFLKMSTKKCCHSINMKIDGGVESRSEVYPKMNLHQTSSF